MFLSLAETQLPIVGGIVIGIAVPLVSTSLTGQQSGISNLCTCIITTVYSSSLSGRPDLTITSIFFFFDYSAQFLTQIHKRVP